MNPSLYYLYPLFFAFFFLKIKNKRDNPIYTIIGFIYLAATVCAALMVPYFVENTPQNVSPSFGAIGYHTLMLLIILSSFRNIGQYSNQVLEQKNETIIQTFTGVTIVFSLFGIYDAISNIDINMLMADIQGLRSKVGEVDESISLVEHVAFFARMYRTSALALFFYYLIYHPQNKGVLIILFLCSLLSVLSGFQYGAREYLLKYCFCFFMMYLLVKKQLTTESQRRIKRIGLGVAIIFVSFFILISQLRFGANGASVNTDLIGGTFGYIGQSFVYFPAFFSEFKTGIGGGGMHFPILFHSSVSSLDLNSQISTNLQMNTFGTAVASWMIDGGIVMATVLSLLYFYLIKYVFKQKMTVFTLTYIVWIFEFIFSCFFFYNKVFSSSLVLSYLSIIFFDILYRSSRSKL